MHTPFNRRQFLIKNSTLAAGVFLSAHISHVHANNDANAWVFGSTSALTGPLAGFGLPSRMGMEAGLAQVNAKGGVHGRPLRLEMLDDAYTVNRSVDNAKQLIANPQVLGLMACLGTPGNTAITPLLESAGLPHLAPLTGASSLRQPGLRNVFHVRASYTDEIHRLVGNLNAMGIRNLSMVYADNAYGKEVLADAQHALKPLDIKMLGASALAIDGKNLEAVVAQTMGLSASAILLGTTGAATTALVAALRKVSPNVPIVGISASLTQAGITTLSGAARGVALTMVFPEPNRAKHQVVRDYQAAMRAAGHTTFDTGTLEGYINARIMAEALQRSGRNADREKLRQALASLRNFDLGGFAVDYSGTGARVGSSYVDLGILTGDGRITT